MKANALFLTAALALLTASNASTAAERVLSPKAQAFADSVRTVAGTTPDLIDRSARPASPKGSEFAHSRRAVPSAGASVDLAHGPSPLLSPRDPRYDSALRELRGGSFQVAPLK